MNLGMDEMLFYGGLLVTALTLIVALICLFLLHLAKVRLEAELDREYGKPPKPVRPTAKQAQSS